MNLARCPNEDCRSYDVTRTPGALGRGPRDSCRHCGHVWAAVPGSIPASRAKRKKAAALSAAYNLSTADIPPAEPAVTLDSRLPQTVHGQPAKYLWRELIRAGSFQHPATGRALDVDAERLSEWAKNFRRMQSNGVKVYVPVNHSRRTEDNRGYVQDVRVREGRLEGLLQLIGEDAAKDAARSEISVRIVPDFQDGKGNRYSEAIEHASLVVNPVIPNQPAAIAASRNESEAAETYTLATALERDTKTNSLTRSTAMQLSAEQLAAIRSETGMADLPDNDTGFTRLIDWLKKKKTDAQNATAQTAAALSRAAQAESRVTELSREHKQPDPDILLDRADTRIERIDNLLEQGTLCAAQADVLKKALKPDGKQASAILLSRDGQGEFPIDTLLKVLKMGSKGGAKSGEAVVLSRSDVNANTKDQPDDKKLAEQGFAEGEKYKKAALARLQI